MTWEWQCNYTFPASFTFISFALINVMAVPVQAFKETMALEKKAGKAKQFRALSDGVQKMTGAAWGGLQQPCSSTQPSIKHVVIW